MPTNPEHEQQPAEPETPFERWLAAIAARGAWELNGQASADGGYDDER
ncbi:MAG TPA: hypothetical protein VD735_02365 [Candidatus Saccharimonadales bacterium]|nr:hypothetical protein [Candidatus Saccharimonadales bacterium]